MPIESSKLSLAIWPILFNKLETLPKESCKLWYSNSVLTQFKNFSHSYWTVLRMSRIGESKSLIFGSLVSWPTAQLVNFKPPYLLLCQPYQHAYQTPTLTFVTQPPKLWTSLVKQSRILKFQTLSISWLKHCKIHLRNQAKHWRFCWKLDSLTLSTLHPCLLWCQLLIIVWEAETASWKQVHVKSLDQSLSWS